MLFNDYPKLHFRVSLRRFVFAVLERPAKVAGIFAATGYIACAVHRTGAAHPAPEETATLLQSNLMKATHAVFLHQVNNAWKNSLRFSMWTQCHREICRAMRILEKVNGLQPGGTEHGKGHADTDTDQD